MPVGPKWKLTSQDDLVWRSWGHQSVVFNPASGDTHLLDLVAGEALLCLQERAMDCVELSALLAERLEIESDKQLFQFVEKLLVQFGELGVLEMSVP